MRDIWIFFIIVCAFGCSDASQVQPVQNDKPITGFNVKWRNLPPLNTPGMMESIYKLQPAMLRYPGGTAAHSWNWETGKDTNPYPTDIVHPISDVKKTYEQTGAEIIFVLDVVNRAVEDQIAMLQASDVPIKFIELGNELYSKQHEEYLIPFPTGKEYADTINAWVPKLKKEFPEAKIAAVLIGKPGSGDVRQAEWNELVTANITVPVEAFTYHIYIAGGETLEERIARFEEVFISGTGKELWVTEYSSMDLDVSKILALADYVDSIADISLNHVLFSLKGNFSKLSFEGSELTLEGQAFADRIVSK